MYKGKAEKYYDGMVPYGCVLYNPYSKKTVVGWNNYKRSLRDSYEKRFGKSKKK